MKKWRIAAIVIIAACLPSALYALPPSLPVPPPLGECENAAAEFERQYNMPKGLLRAIATQESGRYAASAKRRVAWPWTINVEGKGYYFPSKSAALAAIRYHTSEQGVTSLDVGCMQINMKYHGEKFDSVESAIAPRANVKYAAEFLQMRHKRKHNWIDAVADYHNNQRDIGGAYTQRVIKIWKKQSPSLTIADVAAYEGVGGAAGEAFIHASPQPFPDIFGALALGYRRFYGDME